MCKTVIVLHANGRVKKGGKHFDTFARAVHRQVHRQITTRLLVELHAKLAECDGTW